MPSFDQTRVLLSFGAAAGGFEFALQLRKDIMDKFKKTDMNEPRFVYVDAISLEGDTESHYEWDPGRGIFKMSNADWREHYLTGMRQCAYMVFLISGPWLTSNWCWDEFQWYLQAVTEHPVKPVFIVFKDAQGILNGSGKVKDGKGTEHDLRPMWQEMIARPGAVVVDIATDPEPAVGHVVVEGATYSYTHRYVCSESERAFILSKIKNL